MKIIVVKPFENPVIEEIDGSLESMQEIVGGMIELAMPWQDDVGLICNENGKFLGLYPNRYIRTDTGLLYDLIAGTFFLCGADDYSDQFGSIPEELIDKYMKMFELY